MLAGTILKNLSQRYAESGWQHSGTVAVHVVTPLGTAPGEVLPALEHLGSIDAAYSAPRGLVTLSPLLRLHLLNQGLVSDWAASIEESLPAAREIEILQARDELARLTGLAYSLGDRLPAELDVGCAALAAVLTMPGLDADAFVRTRRQVAQLSGNQAAAVFRTLHGVPAESVLDQRGLTAQIARVLDLPAPERRRLPTPHLGELANSRHSSPAPSTR